MLIIFKTWHASFTTCEFHSIHHVATDLAPNTWVVMSILPRRSVDERFQRTAIGRFGTIFNVCDVLD